MALPAAFTQPGDHLLSKPCNIELFKKGLQNIVEKDPGRAQAEQVWNSKYKYYQTTYKPFRIALYSVNGSLQVTRSLFQVFPDYSVFESFEDSAA